MDGARARRRPTLPGGGADGSLAKLIQGELAWDVERLWQGCTSRRRTSLGGTLFAGISAIDIALWDIVGSSWCAGL
jgi:L-alanine-DL-glutamate epimerase-like enolase superfamily enzyme